MAKATNIVGENHKPYVNKQIKKRQKVLSSTSRDGQILTWINGRTSWIRAVSSVNIEDQQIQVSTTGSESDFGASYRLKALDLQGYPAGSALAKDLTLFAGTSKSFVPGGKLNSSLRSGVPDSNSTLPGISTSYGMGGTEFGLNAMPGILDFSTENLNKGALRLSKLRFQANNKKQFNYLETLYMRLGYTVLVEWGNTSYYTSNGFQSGAGAELTLAPEFITANPSNQEESNTLISDFYRRIEELRAKSEGNYDALIGKVRNFNWNFNANGTYNIEIELVSYGDVIESLSVSELYSDTANLGDSPQDDKDKGIIITSTLEAFLTLASYLPTIDNNGQKILVRKLPEEEQGFFTTPTTEVKPDRNTSVKTYIAATDTPSETMTKIGYTRPKHAQGKVVLGVAYFGGNTDTNWLGAAKGEVEFRYIRFADILDFIQEKCLLYDSSSRKLLKINTDPDTNVGYSNGFQLSADPTKVMVRNSFELNLNNEKIKVSVFNGGDDGSDATTRLEQFHVKEEDLQYCKILNLYFNVEFVKSIIKEAVESNTGKLFLFDFLKKLLEAANTSLGGVNKFDFHLKDDQTLEFYDESRPVGYSKLLDTEESAIFNIYGLSNGQGSFVRNMGINSQLSKEFSTMVSVGAQANGQVVGEDATFFSKWNTGLVDRIVPKKLDYNSLLKTQIADSIKFIKLVNQYIFFLKTYSSKGINEMLGLAPSGIVVFPDFIASTVYGSSFITKYTKTQRDFFSYFLALDAQKKNKINPTLGFLPINLQIECDGISGIRIFDELKVDTEFLPTGYTDTLDFVIKTVSHKIGSDNQWITSLETFSIPRSKGKSQASINPKDIETVIAPVVTSPNDTPSYFYSTNALINRKSPNSASLSFDEFKVSIDDILASLNKSPIVQTIYRKFFTDILGLLPYGYEIRINYTYRGLGTGFQVGPKANKTSAHNYGLAIDMSIWQARTSRTESAKKLFGQQPVSDTSKLIEKKWIETKIPDLAKSLGIRWGNTIGGLVEGGVPVYDTVHWDLTTGTWQGDPTIRNWAGNDGLAYRIYYNLENSHAPRLKQSYPYYTKIKNNALNQTLDALVLKDYVVVTGTEGNLNFNIDLNNLFLSLNWSNLGLLTGSSISYASLFFNSFQGKTFPLPPQLSNNP